METKILNPKGRGAGKAEVELLDSENEEIKKALKYLLLKYSNNTMDAIALEMGCARSTLYLWVKEWNESGIMEKAEDLFSTPATEEAKNIMRQIHSRWGAILLSIEQQALRGTGIAKLHAATLIKQWVVDPIENAKVNEGSSETIYASRQADLLPTTITVPKFLNAPKSE